MNRDTGKMTADEVADAMLKAVGAEHVPGARSVIALAFLAMYRSGWEQGLDSLAQALNEWQEICPDPDVREVAAMVVKSIDMVGTPWKKYAPAEGVPAVLGVLWPATPLESWRWLTGHMLTTGHGLPAGLHRVACVSDDRTRAVGDVMPVGMDPKEYTARYMAMMDALR